jgi:pimeloyl-ACP methyl ester carboxylesterase
MAADMVALIKHLGFHRFSIVAHDHGGRVAYRLAIDHPERVDHLAVLDVGPTGEALDRADARLALGYWPWSLREFNVVDGRRQSAADGYLTPAAGRPNLTITADATVRRLVVRRQRLQERHHLQRRHQQPADTQLARTPIEHRRTRPTGVHVQTDQARSLRHGLSCRM